VTLLACAGVARAEDPAPEPAPAATAAPQNSATSAAPEASKDDSVLPDKLPRIGKVKECSGYPLSPREGFRLTFYWLAYESEYAAEPYDTAIYTRAGHYIGSFPSAFVYELKLEGSGVLKDGRVLNYDGDCNYGIGTCFRTLSLAEHPLGAGAQGRRLEPFRSIAVDPRFIPIGTPIYVPELVGIMMPDGTRHDGCLRADDTGGAIKQQKMDFFVESYRNFKYIADNLWWRMLATPHIEEPRCEYLRVHDGRDFKNDHTDWVAIHAKRRPTRMADKVALAKIKRSRAIAQRWLKRHYQMSAGAAKTKNKPRASAGH
jgi:3D (Asp-Asp-Asp) domain-containing protein